MNWEFLAEENYVKTGKREMVEKNTMPPIKSLDDK